MSNLIQYAVAAAINCHEGIGAVQRDERKEVVEEAGRIGQRHIGIEGVAGRYGARRRANQRDLLKRHRKRDGIAGNHIDSRELHASRDDGQGVGECGE